MFIKLRLAGDRRNGELGDLGAVGVQFQARRRVAFLRGGGADLDAIEANSTRIEFGRDRARAGERVDTEERRPGRTGRLEVVAAPYLFERLGRLGVRQSGGRDPFGSGKILLDQQRRDR